MDIAADHVAQDGAKDVVTAWGNVRIRFQDRKLQADRVTINNKTGKGEAIGNVILTQSDGTKMRARRALFDIKSQQGKVFDARGQIGASYFVTGREITRLSETHYQVEDATFTTCTGKIPDWQFGANWVDFKSNNRALFKGGLFKVRNIPVLYMPIGYVPLNTKRKSGLLIPGIGNSNTDGFTLQNAFFWAINRWSDATFYVDYLEKRGVRPGVEFRYTPSKTTKGKIRASFLDDRQTDSTFFKVDMDHRQELPYGFKLTGKLDIESDNFNKTFEDDPNQRTRRSSDSFFSLSKNWTSNSLDVLTRYRDSTEDGRDDTFALLPQVTFKTQRQAIGNSKFYFNQDTSFTSFLTDLDPDAAKDDHFTVQRFDFHPQLSVPIALAPWLSFTPTVGVRETFYSKGIDPDSDKETGAFSRESVDVKAVLEGPKFHKVIQTNSARYPKLKHLIEPRFTYSYIPDMDEEDQKKIKKFDSTDSIKPESKIKYTLTQRLIQKQVREKGAAKTKEILRFDISQSYDFREAFRSAGVEPRPFSDLRFDLDSRLFEPLLLNVDASYDVYDSVIDTFNFELGVKPTSSLSLFVERRFKRNDTTFLQGTFDWTFAEGWRFRASTRYDEKRDAFRENDFSLLYDDKCQCWGFGFDFIKRRIISGGVDRDETKFLFTLTLRGIGSLSSGEKLDHIHRSF